MYKSMSKIFILLICGALVFVGCGNSNATSDSSQASNQNENGVENNSEVESENKGNIKNINPKGQIAQARPNMFGKVKSIIGNEVVLELAEMPQKQKKDEEAKNAGTANGSGYGNKSGQRPQGGAGRGEIKLTGETATILIPVGVPITARSGGEIKNLEIADIYEGSMLQIWIDENKNITRAMMIQGR